MERSLVRYQDQADFFGRTPVAYLSANVACSTGADGSSSAVNPASTTANLIQFTDLMHRGSTPSASVKIIATKIET